MHALYGHLMTRSDRGMVSYSVAMRKDEKANVLVTDLFLQRSGKMARCKQQFTKNGNDDLLLSASDQEYLVARHGTKKTRCLKLTRVATAEKSNLAQLPHLAILTWHNCHI